MGSSSPCLYSSRNQSIVFWIVWTCHAIGPCQPRTSWFYQTCRTLAAAWIENTRTRLPKDRSHCLHPSFRFLFPSVSFPMLSPLFDLINLQEMSLDCSQERKVSERVDWFYWPGMPRRLTSSRVQLHRKKKCSKMNAKGLWDSDALSRATLRRTEARYVLSGKL